jgi:hypothetical protein
MWSEKGLDFPRLAGVVGVCETVTVYNHQVGGLVVLRIFSLTPKVKPHLGLFRPDKSPTRCAAAVVARASCLSSATLQMASASGAGARAWTPGRPPTSRPGLKGLEGATGLGKWHSGRPPPRHGPGSRGTSPSSPSLERRTVLGSKRWSPNGRWVERRPGLETRCRRKPWHIVRKSCGPSPSPVWSTTSKDTLSAGCQARSGHS